jgi:hypothetical protein
MSAETRIKLDVDLIADTKDSSILLLSIGYGNSHLVAQIESKTMIDTIVRFISEHREGNGMRSIEIGRFSSCPVTLNLSQDSISFIIDSSISADGFGQSAGLYVPRGLLDELVAMLKGVRSKVSR